MWRLIYRAGKALLTDSSVAKGTTVLSEHTSKKAGEAALKKVQSVPVKKVPEGSAIRKAESPESKQLSKDIEKADTQRRKDFKDKSGSAKSKRIKENRRKAMEKSQRTKKEAKQTGVEEARPGGGQGLRGMRREQYDEWTGGEGYAKGSKVKKKAKKGYVKKYANGGSVRKVRS
jgi:hypothetical protein|tara:strand:- start:40 stop:561 length:522 start_codon:yes stop_codon:yes gene_type:complete